MIYGVGTDICDVRRIRDSLERHGERFAHKVLSDAELATWRQRSARWPERGVRYLATRFAAKEAFTKAVGLGMRMPMTWRAVQFLNAPSGKPIVVTSGALTEFMQSHGIAAQVSLTDEAEYAVAFVIVEKI